MSDDRFIVADQPDAAQYVLIDRGEDLSERTVIGEESYLDIDADGAAHRIFYHTGVLEAYGGQGLASVLVRAAADGTIAAGRKIVPVCPYVVKWVAKHPDVADHVVKATPSHLAALKNMRS